MALRKCPRCELNYILDGGDLCTVCREEVHGKKTNDDDVMLCSVCGEMPAILGKDLCAGCQRELRAMEQNGGDDVDDDDLLEEATLEAEQPASEMDELDEVDDIEALGDDDVIEVDDIDDVDDEDDILTDFAKAQ